MNLSTACQPTSRPPRWPRFSGLLLALALAAGCDELEEPAPSAGAPLRYQALVRRTSHGVPHILADTLGSAGFGQGYAFAQDHLCTLADQVLKVRGERASLMGAGPDNMHLASDFAYRVLRLRERAETFFARQPADVRELVQGFVSGYNQYIIETNAAGQPCAGQPWVRALSAEDLTAHHLALGLAASGYQLIYAIAAAQPPSTQQQSAGPRLPAPTWPHLTQALRAGFGSNGWALGAERTQGGRGMLLANPHFPWEGELRMWESHLTVPGQLDVYGASLLGLPGVLIGFNEHVAWTHTFSAGARFTVHALPLVPGKPTHYYLDGEQQAMEAQDITVQLKQPDGSLTPVTRTYYRSHFGPLLVLPNAPWSPQMALSYRDANLDNENLVAQFLDMNRARSLAQFQQAHERWQALPWVNTLAADREGNAWYIDSSSTPNLSPQALEAWGQALQDPTSPASLFLRMAGVVLLDGSTRASDWVQEPGSVRPGLVPYARLPRLQRRDFVFNANNSHWLANPAAPLEGYSPLHGGERQPLTVRARMNARLLTEVGPGSASGEDGRFSLEELQASSLDNRSYSAELLRDQVVARCAGRDFVQVGEQAVDIRQACAVLGAWDQRFATHSVGAPLWREFIGAWGGEAALMQAGTLLASPYSPQAPLSTPHTLSPAPSSGEDPVLVKLAQAVRMLGQANIALDQPLGQVQFTPHGSRRIPVPGGVSHDGVLNLVTYWNLKSTLDAPTPRGPVLHPATELSSEGYVINTGTSYLMALEFTDAGPRGKALLTYGQSEVPHSPHFKDQAELFSLGQWRDILFTEQQIRADPTLREQRVLMH